MTEASARRWEITPRELEQLRAAIGGSASRTDLSSALAALASWALALVDAATILVAVRREPERALLVEAAVGRGAKRWRGVPLAEALHSVASGPESWLRVPIQLGDEDAGVVAARARHRQRLDEDDAEILRLLAVQAGAALAQHRSDARITELYRQTQRRAEQLDVAAELDRTLIRARRIGDGLDFAVGLLKSHLGYDRVAIYLREPDQDRFVLRARAGGGPAPGDQLDVTQPSAAAWAVRSAEPQLVTSLAELGSGPGDTLRGASELAVPIAHAGKTTGVLVVTSGTAEALDEHDLALAGSIADDLAIALENLRLAARAREDAAAAERARLARELHDDTAQQLVAIGRGLDLLAMETTDPQLIGRIEVIHDMVDEAILNVRRISRDLRPTILEDLGLSAALEALVSDAARTADQSITFNKQGRERPLPPRIELTIYRIVQEALANSIRHAGAEHIRVRLAFTSEAVTAEVADDGHGFLSPTGPTAVGRGGGLGVLGMRERADEIGAQLRIASDPETGTTVRVVAPIALGAAAIQPTPDASRTEP